MKINIAQKLLSELVDSISEREDIELALRVYGHQYTVISREKRNCEDSKLEVPFGKNNADSIKSKLYAIIPKGTTMIAYALEKAVDDFPTCSHCRNTIVLITDGIDECDGDPCSVAKAIQETGVIFRPFVIGMGLGVEHAKQFECVGAVSDVNNETGFKNVLDMVISEALNMNSTALVYGKVLDAKTKEPIAAEIVYDILPVVRSSYRFVKGKFETTIKAEGDTIKNVGLSHSNPVSGAYKMILPNSKKYYIRTSADGFKTTQEIFDISGLGKYMELKSDIYLEPIEKR